MQPTIFDTFVASQEADVNIDIDVNETGDEGAAEAVAAPEAPIDVTDTPEASELEVQDTAAEIEAADVTGDNVEQAVSSLESLYEVLELTASQESQMSDVTVALVGLHLNGVGALLGGVKATNLVPSLESDNYFERTDVVASMEAVMDRIKEGTGAIGGTLRKMYEGVKQYVKDMSVAHTRAVRQLDVAKGYAEKAPFDLEGSKIWRRTAKRLALGQEVADPAAILKGAQDLLKLATQVLADRKGVQVYANAAQMLAKDGAIDEERISAELRKAYPVLKVTGEDGNAPLMIGNTAVFLEQGGKGEAGGIVRLGFKNNTVEVTKQHGFVSAAKAGYKVGAHATKDSIKIGAATGAATGALTGGAVGAAMGAVGGASMGVGAKVASRAYGAAVGGTLGATGTTWMDVTSLNAQQAKAFLDIATKLIEVVAAYETNVEGRSATNEQIAKLVDDATTAAPVEEGQEVDKATLKSNAKTRRALAKSWKKTLKTETKVASWALNTANALGNYVISSCGEVPEEAPEAPEGAKGGEE